MKTRRYLLPWGVALPIVIVVALLTVADTAKAALLFSDAFAYPNGPLAGNSGGTGWASSIAWAYTTGTGENTVANPLPGTSGKSVRIAANAAVVSRPLSTTYVSGGTNAYYISFGFNANPFQGLNNGMYAGVGVYLNADPSNNLFMGMPGSSGAFGFDWTGRGDPSASASDGTTYLALYAITPGSGDTTSVTMYATTNLLISGTALAATTPWASITNDPNFSFDSVNVSGAYNTGSVNFAGLAMADNPTEAVAFTQTAVPEPGVLTGGAIALVLGGAAVRSRHRRRRV
jgi:hypothetical protein